MADVVLVQVVRMFRWRGRTHRYGDQLRMPARTARRLLRARAVTVEEEHEELPVRRYRCSLVRGMEA